MIYSHVDLTTLQSVYMSKQSFLSLLYIEALVFVMNRYARTRLATFIWISLRYFKFFHNWGTFCIISGQAVFATNNNVPVKLQQDNLFFKLAESL